MPTQGRTARLGNGAQVHEVIAGHLRCGIDRRDQLAEQQLHSTRDAVTCRRCLTSAAVHTEPMVVPGSIAEAVRELAGWTAEYTSRIRRELAAGRSGRDVAREAGVSHTAIQAMSAAPFRSDLRQ